MLQRVACFALLASCATIASEGQGDHDLPSSGVGPFRKLAQGEVGNAPYVLDDQGLRLREPAILRASDAPENREVYLYATGTDSGHDAIFRSHALDARSFYGTSGHAAARPPKVLVAKEAWEGSDLSGPWALRKDSEVWLYYTTSSGIGLARGDGLTFGSRTLVLAIAGARSPSVVRLDDGSLRMLYEERGAIWEASSNDGVSFQAKGVVLTAGVAPDTDAGLREFDTLSVGDPCVALRTTAAGRLQFRVLYSGRAKDGSTAIGFAARYGTDGPLVRNASPIYATSNGNAAPALFEWIDPNNKTRALTMLYDTESKKMALGDSNYPVIAGALAPVDAKLPEPMAYPDAP